MNTGDWIGPDARIERARILFDHALFDANPGALDEADLELDAVEADLALARARIIHGRFLERRTGDPSRDREEPQELELFQRAARLYERRGDRRGQAEALFWIGCFHQVVRRDNETAVPILERSLELAALEDDKATMSEALRHLGIAEHAAGRLDQARERLEESVRLRREIGFLPGVAGNMVGLSYIAAGQGRREDALALIEEATAIATATGSVGILRQLDEARASL
jgi:tetratricopeptide (TPR) repeat protein